VSEEKLTPERAVRLLRAKGAELENKAAVLFEDDTDVLNDEFGFIAADIALVAQLLADHIERTAYTLTTSASSGSFTATTHQRVSRGYLKSILNVTEFEVGSKEEADYVAALKAECDAYLGRRWGPDHHDYDEMGQ
jgi:hypothetical protein